MRKSLNFLIAIGVCALSQVGAAAQTVNSDLAMSKEAAAINLPFDSTVSLSVKQIQDHLGQARMLLKSAGVNGAETVTLAVMDPETSELHLLPVSKDDFLTKDASFVVSSQLGNAVRLTVVRANGVNTAVKATDTTTGRELTPLMVAYPIERSGVVTEIAHYTSAHPALMSSEVTGAGEIYISTMLQNAVAKLSAKGIQIPADIVEIAEHLCVVEHTDHKRFKTEQHAELFPEILSLYALNRGNTYRYSVSTAGAGGMIQMIPRTYEGIRQLHANVPLQADFVNGMRNHDNALQAMLLYMNDTWNYLAGNSEVQDALRTGIATKSELLAAGYNSNPMRLPTYLKTGGAGWRTLIPAETQMYLAIYKSVDSNVRFRSAPTVESGSLISQAFIAEPSATAALLGWLGRSVSIAGPLLSGLF